MKSEEHTESSAEQASADQSSGLVRWLCEPRRRRLLVPATGAWILALDWLLFSSNALSAWTATPVVMLVGFVLGSSGTYVIQWKGAIDYSGTEADPIRRLG